MIAFISSKKGTQAAAKRIPYQKSDEKPLGNVIGARTSLLERATCEKHLTSAGRNEVLTIER